MTIKDSTIPPEKNKIKYVEISVSWNEKNIEGKARTKPLEMKFSTYVKNSN